MSAVLESLTVEELAALCGLTASSGDGTRLSAAWDWDVNDWRGIMQHRGGQWRVYVGPLEHGHLCWADSKHAALVALAKHLNLTPKDTPMPKYKRIDRHPEIDDYTDYTPMPGDRWHFGRGEPWTVSAVNAGAYVGPAKDPVAYGAHRLIRALTTHIERPIRVRDVRGPDYEPKPGDVLCGPDGPLFVVSYVSPGGLPHVTPVGRKVPEVGLAVAHFALCTRIDREE